MVIREEQKIFCQPHCYLCGHFYTYQNYLLLISQDSLNVDHEMNSGMAFTKYRKLAKFTWKGK